MRPRKINSGNSAVSPRAGAGGRFYRPEKPSKRRGGFWKTLLVALFAVLVAVALLWLPTRFQGEGGKPAADASAQDVGAAGFDIISDKENRLIVHLKPSFIVNLAGLGGRYAIKAAVWLEVDKRDVVRELNEQQAKFSRMMEEVVLILQSYSYAELLPDSGKNMLKEEIRRRLNRFLTRGQIIQVLIPEMYFGEFLPKPRPAED